MKLSLNFLPLIFLASSALAVDFHVKMSQDCRHLNGNFQSHADGKMLEMIPINSESAAQLDKLATLAAQVGHDVTFNISGSVISDRTYPGPHGIEPGTRVIQVLTYKVD